MKEAEERCEAAAKSASNESAASGGSGDESDGQGFHECHGRAAGALQALLHRYAGTPEVFCASEVKDVCCELQRLLELRLPLPEDFAMTVAKRPGDIETMRKAEEEERLREVFRDASGSPEADRAAAMQTLYIAHRPARFQATEHELAKRAVLAAQQGAKRAKLTVG